jgi:hypothetical protein
VTYILVIVACLHGVCTEHIIAEGLSLTACVSASQIEAARWVGKNPGYMVERIRCDIGKDV